MKKTMFGILLVLLLLFGAFYFWLKNDEQPTINKEDNTVEIKKELTVEEKDEIKKQLHGEGLGFIHALYLFNDANYLSYNRLRDQNYIEPFLGDQLVWVEKNEDSYAFTPLVSGDYGVKLVMNQENPYFVQGSAFFFVFYESRGTKEMPMNGKGYVYQVDGSGKPKMVLETEGVFHDFYTDKEKGLVFVEKIETENRNQFPSFFAPYELHYKAWKNGKWDTVKVEEVTPDLQEEYQKYEEKYNENQEENLEEVNQEN